MPRLNELRQRFDSAIESIGVNLEGETLVFDQRHGMTPHQAVERKFGIALLREQGARVTAALSLRSGVNRQAANGR